ncbi:MAG: hypothetical protein NWF02_01030 [Candidatus Bathyarchaeota archaeon]|nr:hypothetical protein [Candidatus Bathyarchaeum sp.]
MRAVTLGVIITLIGILMMVYGLSNVLTNFTWFSIGAIVTMLGVGILGIKLRQWVYRH